MRADTVEIKQGTIPVGYQLRLVGAAACTALVNRFGVDNSWLGSTAVGNGEVVTLGEYLAEQDFNITVTVGSLDYQIVQSSSSIATTITGAAHAITNAVLWLNGVGVPVDYTDGTPPATGEAVAQKGSLYSDTTNGDLYINGGTKAQPVWKLVTRAA